MNQLEIKRQIDANNKTIESTMRPNVFTLNNLVLKLLKENEELQSQCEHVFEDGFCIYCYKDDGKE